MATIQELATLRQAWFDAMQKYHDAHRAYRDLWSDPEVKVTPELRRERGMACGRVAGWMTAEEEAFARLREAAQTVSAS